MAIVFYDYSGNTDDTWYDSSNIVFSSCFDSNKETKSVKVVFKGGRCYLYKDVLVDDYLLAKTSDSSGEGFNKYIVKKYKGIRLPDVSVEDLEKLKNKTIEEEQKLAEEKVSNLAYTLKINPDTKEFQLLLNDKLIFEGEEDKVSVTRLLKSMSIAFHTEALTEPILNEERFETKPLIPNNTEPQQ